MFEPPKIGTSLIGKYVNPTDAKVNQVQEVRTLTKKRKLMDKKLTPLANYNRYPNLRYQGLTVEN
jgi:hypothetical protein